MQKPVFKRLFVLAALLSVMTGLGFFFVPDSDAFDTCNSYNNSTIEHHWGYGWACSGTGPGCTECVLLQPMGYTVCLESGTRSFCYDYQY